MKELSLVAWQIRYEQRAFWRNRRAAVLTFLFPLLIFVIFAALNGDRRLTDVDGGITFVTFYLPGIMAYAVVTGSFSNLAVSMAAARESGVLKRVRGTPLPWWAFLAGRIGSAVLVTLTSMILLLLLGRLAFDADVRAETLPGLVVAIVLGSACFTALGIGIARMLPNAETAGPIQAVVVMPLAFISGVFFPVTGEPHWLQDIADVFPLKALADLLHNAFNPLAAGPGIVGHDVRSLLVWTAIGAAMMVRFLRAEARSE